MAKQQTQQETRNFSSFSWEAMSSTSSTKSHQQAGPLAHRLASSDSTSDVEYCSLAGEQLSGSEEIVVDPMLPHHLALLQRLPGKDELDEIVSAPLFTYPVLEHARSLAPESSEAAFAQYALFAGDAETLQATPSEDPRIFYNVSAPSSIFICGSQGSGKSHSLSCMLENCLIPSAGLGHLPHPLTGIVFHYDTFISDSGGAPCEAAYLASDPNVKDTYSILENVKVEELRLNESDLNTKRMLELMAFGDRSPPLYMQVIQRILRDMRIAQQRTRSAFKYADFVQRLHNEDLTPDQLRPLRQRLDTLESFMVGGQVDSRRLGSAASSRGTDWTPKAGEINIVDLSCPCVTAAMACSLFNICFSIFLEQKSSIGRVVALDEAHKYMGETAECEALTNNLLSTIRLQRHLGARVIISTQEPTISPKLLDLCSVTIVHRFTSPDWLNVLTKHLAGISTVSKVARKLDATDPGDEAKGATGLLGVAVESEDPILELFSRIVKLRTGEALVFAPSAIVGLEDQDCAGGTTRTVHKRLAHHVIRVIVRARISADGGKSIMAS